MAAESVPPVGSETEDLASTRGEPVSPEASGAAEPTLDGAFAADGVDLTVIRWMLERTPEERLRAVQQLLDATWAVRGREA